MKKIQLGGHRKGSKIKGYALIDDSMFAGLNIYKWCINTNGYVLTRGKNNQNGNNIFMHHIVFGEFPKGKQIDHINRNPIDNRLENLRIASKVENGRNRGKNKNNTSGYKGVTYAKNNKKWMAGIKINSKRRHIGLYETALEASIAYDKEALKHFGEFAYLNNKKLCTFI